MSKAIDFIRDFLDYVEKVGIYDEFDNTTQKMVTSKGVYDLIQQARSCMPEKLKPAQAARAMRDLSESERDRLIGQSENDSVVDLRKEFQAKMSRNGGAQGVLRQLVEALDHGDQDAIRDAVADAVALQKGPENVVPPPRVD